MATSRPQSVGNDPAVVRTVENRLAQASIVARGQPTVSNNEAIFPGTVASVSGTSVTVAPSTDSADITTISSNGVYVTTLDQTVNNYKLAGGVNQVVAGNNITISSTLTSGTGIVTVNANVGNVALLYLDGNASNVLHGDGSWSADITTYGNSNVVSLLAAFGSNTITTTGNISVGNLNVAGNVTSNLLPNANVTYNLGSNTQRWNDIWLANSTIYLGDASLTANGNTLVVNSIEVTDGNVGTIGNIASLNLDGSSSNVLYGNGVFAAAGGGNANTGNVTFNDINIIGTGNLHLQPDPANTGSYLDIFLTSGPDLHLVASAAANLILGKDDGPNVMTSWDGNVYVQSWNTGSNTQGGVWNFGEDGSIVFPTLTVDLHNGGNQQAQTLQFGDPTQQAVITGPTPPANINAQRLIIQGQRGNGQFSEGGDVYFWAGDADTNGGDIKIYAGDADNVSAGYGGYINLDGGSGFDNGGQVNITGGYSANGQGGAVSVSAGQGGTDGGAININGGSATANQGGNIALQAGYGGNNGGEVRLTGGSAGVGLPGYGNVVLVSGASTWTFDNTGTLTVPQNIHGNGALQLQGLANGNTTINIGSGVGGDIDMVSNLGNINLYTANNQPWIFDQAGNLTAPGAINVGNMVIGTVPGDITADANTGVTFNVSGPDGGFAVNYLDEVGNANTSGGELAFSSETGNATYRISLSDDLGNGFATKIWRFDGTGNLALAGGNSIIQSLPNNAGDGSGLSTLNLYPDASTGDDRYLILDPTGPAHLHLRAGGLQDASNVLLYLGGEQTYVQVDDGYHRVTIGSYDIGNTTGYNWRFDYDGNLVLPLNTFAVKYANGTQVPIVSSASGSNTQIQFNSNGAFGASANYTFTDTVGGGSVEVGNELLLLGNGTISTANSNLNIQPAGNLVVSASAYNWTFDTNGVLTLPGNLVSSGASPAPIISGFSSISSIRTVTTPQPLASLTATAGARAFASDANLVAAGNFGANVSNGGANTVPVWSDGTNWYIG